jgi:hypothetical protein
VRCSRDRDGARLSHSPKAWAALIARVAAVG